MTLVLEGRIDSNNAASVEKDVMQAVEKAPGKDIVIDVRALEYISSAGLRVLMKLRKQAKKALPIVNVSPEVFEILEVTGFSDLFEVHKRMREMSIEGCQEIGSGANGKVYRLTQDEMIKVYRPEYTLAEIEDERKAAKNAFLMGVPCAIAFDTVRVGDSYGTIYEMLNAATLAERIRENPARVEELAVTSAKLLRELHATVVPQGQMSSASRMYHRSIDQLTDYFTSEEMEKLHALWDSVPKMNRFIHNDYHSKNIMETGDGELMLIDLGDSGVGHPLFDLIHCYMIYNIIGMSSSENKDDDISFIGLTYGESRRFWNIFSETYFRSAEKARVIEEHIKPFGLLMYYTSSMANPLLPRQYHPVYVKFTREQILSRYDELLGSLADLWED